MRISALLVIFIFMPILAVAANKKSLKDQTECSRNELNHKDCLLRLGQLELRLNNERIVTDDGVWKNVDNLPAEKDGVDWGRVRLSALGGMVFLEVWVWEENKGEAELQSLNWHVAVVKDAKLTFKVKEVVSRRRHLKAIQGAKKYINDKIEDHGLKLGPKGAVLWYLGKKTAPLF